MQSIERWRGSLGKLPFLNLKIFSSLLSVWCLSTISGMILCGTYLLKLHLLYAGGIFCKSSLLGALRVLGEQLRGFQTIPSECCKSLKPFKFQSDGSDDVYFGSLEPSSLTCSVLYTTGASSCICWYGWWPHSIPF